MRSKVDEKLGFGKSTILGFQHVAVMYGGAVVVPILIGSSIGLSQAEIVYLISFDLFTCGVAAMVRAFGIGRSAAIMIPAVMAVSVVVVTPAISVGPAYGVTVISGSVIGAGIIVAILSQFATNLVRYMPTV